MDALSTLQRPYLYIIADLPMRHSSVSQHAEPAVSYPMTSGDTVADATGLAAIAAAGALLSVAFTGFILGESNNLFHLPIVASLYDEPQFRQDAFIQSLRHFAAGPWLVLRGSALSINEAFWLFFALNYASRFIFFVGFLLCVDILGIRTRRDRCIVSALLAVTSLMQGGSFAGGGDLFPVSFTHSALANGTTLICLYLAMRRSLAAAFAVNGIVFFINAFVSVWNLVPLSLIVAYYVAQRSISVKTALRGVFLGILGAIAFSAPVINNILSNPEFGQPIAFDYVEFLRQYYPDHFLFNEISFQQKVAAAMIVLLAASSLVTLGERARPLQIALLGYIGVYIAGIALPYLSSKPALLNLHLLRASTFFHILAALGSLTLVTRWLSDKDVILARLVAPLLVLILCTVRHLALVAPLVILCVPLISQWKSLGQGYFFRTAGKILLGLSAVGIALIGVQNARKNHELRSWIGEWTAIGQWANKETPIDAVFMVPTQDLMQRDVRMTAERTAVVEIGSTTFEFVAHRRVWFDFKRGAAAMWTPTYYSTWRSRLDDITTTPTPRERVLYSRAHDLKYVIELCSESAEFQAVFRTDRLCVFQSAGAK